MPETRTRRGSGPTLAMIALLAVLLGSCALRGPGTLTAGRNDYNIALQHSSNQQLLLNLVRLKYRDSPAFLEISAISSQYEFDANANASALLTDNPSGGTDPDQFGLNAGLRYSEKPTLTFTPLQGEDFVQRLLTPLSLDTLMLMAQSGWSIERILRLSVQRMNGIRNAPTASGPTPTMAPTYVDFARAASLLRELQMRDVISLGYMELDNQQSAVMRIATEASDSPEANELRALLGLAPKRNVYFLATPSGELDPTTVAFKTRSLLGVLFYLSQSVSVPASDIDNGLVTITRYDNGAPFDWDLVTAGLFKIHNSPSRPRNAAVAVQYRRHWFFIEDNDLASKSTFSLLAQLFALQSGKAQGTAPTLTLPVGD